LARDLRFCTGWFRRSSAHVAAAIAVTSVTATSITTTDSDFTSAIRSG
jgi:hypothetical protein